MHKERPVVDTSGVRAWVRSNSLSIVLFALFAIFLAGQTLTGWEVVQR